ncbi:MAG TPA: ABC transporter permease, partial [Bryobacteraceae bacterium]|nr:ABC transporter permease [Bryobacteraceae bacterium]
MAYLIIFHRLIVRPLLREPGRALLTAFAVALGVAVVLAIEMAGEAAAGSFRSSLEALAGEADFEVTASGGIPPETLTSLATAPHALQLMPRIEDYGTLIESRRSVAIIGVDAIGNSAVWSNTGNSINTPQPDQLSEDQVWVGTELGLKAGDSIRLLLNDREWSFRVGGLLPNSTGDVVAMDLALATRSLRRSGTLDRILIKTPSPDKQSEWQSILQQRLPAGVKLAPYGARTDENRRMLAAFRWNLRVLSYIALVVGAFLIYNT